MSTLLDQKRMALLLSAWAGASMALALLAFLVEPKISGASAQLFVRGVAAECLAWGLVEVGVALITLQQIQRVARYPSLRSATASGRFIRLLRFVVRLNIAFLGLALLLIAWGTFGGGPLVLGHGVGVLIQCAFLLILDRKFLNRLGE